jgi:glycine/D-amino acid oxidase-like deaminating enzyme/nitrite reductase/ring-hydroxylating ferredoxin subunit
MMGLFGPRFANQPVKSDGGKRMDERSGLTESLWMQTVEAAPYSRLERNAHADVCVVGGGIAGLTVAYELVRAGKQVIVLEAGEIGSGETGRTTAHLSNALDDRYFEIENLHGERGAQLAAESHSKAIDEIEAIVGLEGIQCDFERLDGYLFVPPGEDQGVLDREFDAARRAGLREVELVSRAPLSLFDTGRCLRFPNQAQFHPLRYLQGLARAIHRLGGHIHTDTLASTIEGGSGARVETRGGLVITAASLVVATNTPVNDRVTMHTKQAAYRTYAVGARVPKGSITKALYWDTPDPYHYVRVQSESATHDILIVGGEDHKTGQSGDTDERFDRLTGWARERFPMMEDVPYWWSGQVMEPVDRLAFIGRNPGDAPNVYIVTGDSGNGMTHGTIAGLLLKDLILGNENPWASLYDPSRITLRAAGRFISETANAVAQYGDLITPGDIEDASEVPPETGAILRRNLKKIAVYRDKEGRVHELSAICPHLGCVVHWNAAEKSWDCPCHGSRFTPRGEVVNGPAISRLPPVEH